MASRPATPRHLWAPRYWLSWSPAWRAAFRRGARHALIRSSRCATSERRKLVFNFLCLRVDFLAGRPVKCASTEQVKVEMKNGLAGAASGIEDRSISRHQVAFAGELRRRQVQFSDYGLILRRGLVQ